MDDRTLAHLRWVDPATAWKSERDDFLPWLTQPENLRRLGAALSLRLRPLVRNPLAGPEAAHRRPGVGRGVACGATMVRSRWSALPSQAILTPARAPAARRPRSVGETEMTDRRLLTRVALRNYKSIGACDIRPAQLSFLVGPNGSGKGNFLDALRFVADALGHSLDHALRDRGGIGEVRRRSGGHPTHFGIRLEFNLAEWRGHYSFTVGARPRMGYEVQSEECLVVRRDRDESHHYRVERGEVRRSTLSPPPVASADRLYLVTVSGLDAFRAVYETLSTTGFYNLNPDAIRDLQLPDPGILLKRDGSNLASVLANLAKHAPEHKRRIETYLGKVVSGVAGVDRRTIGPRETLVFRQEVRGARDPWRFPAANMSDGTLRALGVLAALFQGFAMDGSDPRLVGIEEPEIALHPAAAGVLVDSIRDAAEHAQVLVTSHSPDLLDDEEISADSIVAVVLEHGESRIGPLDEVGRSALRERLYTAGDLLRLNQLDPDPAASRLTSRQISLFGPNDGA